MNEDDKDHSEQIADAGSIRDLSDFCLQWDELKKHVEDKKIADSCLNDEQRKVLFWLKALAESTCKRNQ